MANAIEVITYGGGEAMETVFNAIAAMTHGKHSLVGNLLFFTLAFGTVKVMINYIKKFDVKIPINWLVIYIISVKMILIPTGTAIVVDRVTGFQKPVKNLPYVFVYTVGTVSLIGDVLAKKMESLFSIPKTSSSSASSNNHSTIDSVLSYRKSGIAMAHKLVNLATNFRIRDHDLEYNMREYVKECVCWDIAIGKYTVQDLRTTGDMWGLVTARPSPHGGLFYRTRDDNRGVKTERLTCKEAAPRLTTAFNREVELLKSYYGKIVMPHSAKTGLNPSTALSRNLVNSYSYLASVSMTANEIMRQNIMRNVVEDGMLSKAQEVNTAASLQRYATLKADMLAEATYATQGGMAQKAVAIFKIIFELLIYSMFPIVIVIGLAPGCYKVLVNYGLGILWLQSWAPMFCVLNLIVNIYGRTGPEASIYGVHGGVINFDSIPSLGSAAKSVSHYASYAMMSIPFISWVFFKYGAGAALGNAAQYLGNVISTTTGRTADEVVSGNTSSGNTNVDNHSHANNSAFQTNLNPTVGIGTTQLQQADGSMVRIATTGETSLDRNAMISKLGVGLNDRNEISNTYSEMSSKALSRAENSAVGYQQNMSEAYDNLMNYQSSRSKSQSYDTANGLDESSSISKSISDMKDIVNTYSETYGVDHRTAIEQMTSKDKAFSASLGVSGTIPGGQLLKAAGINIGGGLNAESRYGSRSSDSTTDIENTAETETDQLTLSKKFNKSMDDVNRYFSSESIRNSDSDTSSFAQGFTSKYAEAQSYREDISQNLSDSASYAESANSIKTYGISSSSDLSNEFLSWASNQKDEMGYPLGAQGVSNAMKDPSMRSGLVEGFLASNHESLLNQFNGMKPQSKNDIVEGYNNSSSDFKQNAQSTSNTKDTFDQVIIAKSSERGLDSEVDTQMQSEFDQTRRVNKIKNGAARNVQDDVIKAKDLYAKKIDLAERRERDDK